jgi:hypothetical protein
MARIVCFSDSLTLVRTVCQSITSRDHTLFPLPGSQLTDHLRRTVCRLAPDVILIELTRALDNPHLFFFLRSDEATRHIPLVVIAPSPELEPYAAALGADGFLCEPRPELIARALDHYLPQPAPAFTAPATPIAPVAPPRRPRAVRPAEAPVFAPLIAIA